MTIAILAKTKEDFLDCVFEKGIGHHCIWIEKISDCFGRKFDKMERCKGFSDRKIIMAVQERLTTKDFSIPTKFK